MSDDIRPFTIAVSDDEIADLQRRLRTTRWPEQEPVDDWSQGIPLGYLRDVCDYWADGYDWRRCEAMLNAHPNFLTEIRGLDVHLQHVRSPHEDATPLLITHGWPGTIIEFQKIIGPLTNPTEHGGTAADAFHLVIPSLPGFGWSAKPTATGTDLPTIATMWDELMVRLGYSGYVAQGGDWGGAITSIIGAQALGNCAAIHTNMPFAGPDPETMSDITDEEQQALDSFKFYDRWDSGYSKQQGTRPQTVGYGLADSPSGQAGWILEKFHYWTDCDGDLESVLSRDELLDNVSVYWFTNTATSSARIYWEGMRDFGFGTIDVPTAASIFPKEILRTSRRWASKRYTDIVYWNALERGGHFAAFEQPEAFVAELRASVPLLLDAAR